MIEYQYRDKMDFFDIFRRKNGIKATVEKIYDVFAIRIIINVGKNEKRRNKELKSEKVYRIFSEQNVRRICFKNDFSDEKFFTDRGLKKADDSILYEKKLADITRKCAEHGGKTLAVFSGYADRSVIDFIDEICKSFRYIMLDVGENSEAVAENIGKRYGVSAIEKPSDGKILHADCAVIFDSIKRTVRLGESCVAIFRNGTPNNLVDFQSSVISAEFETEKMRNEDEIPGGYDPNVFLAEAVICGKIKNEDIKVKNVKIRKKQ